MEMNIITLAKAAEITGLTAEYLSRLCRTGKIDNAVMIGKAYVIPRQWAENLAAQKKDTFSVRDAADLAGVSAQAIYLAVATGKLTKAGRRITKNSLHKYIADRKQDKQHNDTQED